MSKEQTKKMRIRLKAYDHVVLEQAKKSLQFYVLHTNTKIQENNLK